MLLLKFQSSFQSIQQKIILKNNTNNKQPRNTVRIIIVLIIYQHL